MPTIVYTKLYYDRLSDLWKEKMIQRAVNKMKPTKSTQMRLLETRIQKEALEVKEWYPNKVLRSKRMRLKDLRATVDMTPLKTA
jgi:hypothetical protein